MDVNEALSRYFEAATGVTQLTRQRAERLVRNILKQGEQATRSPQDLVDSLVERSRENREAILSLVRSESRRVVRSMGLATQADVERLQRQVAELRRSGAKKATSRSGAKKATSRSGAKKAARKTAAKKTTKKASGGGSS